MAWVLSNIQTSDGYTAASTSDQMEAYHVTLLINNAAVYVQRQPMQGNMATVGYELEALYPPGFYSLTRNLAAIRVRSAVPGQPALVTIEALARGE